LLFSAAANLAELGCPPALAHELLTEAGRDAGLSPSEVRRQIDCGLRHRGRDWGLGVSETFADAGVAVIVLSAVGRSKDDQGRSSYAGQGMNLASFRESSELEFGCDDALILHPEADNAEGDTLRLRHLKSRPVKRGTCC